MGAEGERRTVYVRVGSRKEAVEIDGNTTAEELIRKLGGDPERDVITVNGSSTAPGDKIFPLLTGEDDDIRLVPKAKVGRTASTSNFLANQKRLKQEETLLREIGFYPAGRGVYRGLVRAGGKVIEMDVLLPATFPYTRPIIVIHDPSFLGKHPCIIQREFGIEVHFYDSDWKPWMHAADLVVQAVDFLDRVAGRRCTLPWERPGIILELLELLRSSRRP